MALREKLPTDLAGAHRRIAALEQTLDDVAKELSADQLVQAMAVKVGEARKLLERVAAIHPVDCDAADCPFTPIRKWLAAA